MRASLVVAMVAVVMLLGPSGSAGFFPDLPGSRILEESITGREPSGAASSNAPAPRPSDDRVPAPDTSDAAETVTRSAADPDHLKMVTEMPGGGGLPILKDVTGASSDASSVAPLIALAALVVFAMTRFLYRLNELGRRA